MFRLFECDHLPVARLCDLAQRDDLPDWRRRVANQAVPYPDVQKVLKDAALVPVVIVDGIRLRFPYADIGKTPDFRIGMQPPMPVSYTHLKMNRRAACNPSSCQSAQTCKPTSSKSSHSI